MLPKAVADVREVTVRHQTVKTDPADRRDARTRRHGSTFLGIIASVFCVWLWVHVHVSKPSLADTFTYFGYWIAVAVFSVAIALAILTRLPARSFLAALALRLIPTKWVLTLPFFVFTGLVLFSIVRLDKDSNAGYYHSLSSIVAGGIAAVLVAFGGWFTFQVTFGFVACREICNRQRKLRLSGDSNRSTKAVQPKGSRPKQTRAVLQRLSRHNYALLSSITIDAADAFVAELTNALNSKNIVFLIIERHVVSGNYLHEIQSEFQALLRRLQVSPHPFIRSTESYSRALEDLLYFRRVVVIIRNMDAAGYTDGPNAAQKAVQRGVDELTGADIPFITIVQTNSLPPALMGESIAITPPNDLELSDTGADSTPGDRLKRGRAIRRLAVALQSSGLQVNTVLKENDSVETIVGTTERLNNDGLVRFGCDLISSSFRGIGKSSTGLEMIVLRKLIDRLVMTGGLTVGFAELYDDLNEHSRLDISRTIQNLMSVEMLTDDFPHAERRLGYRDPRVGEIAMGWALARRGKPFKVSAHRTALCASAEIFGRIRQASTAPFPHPALPWPSWWGAHAPHPRRDTSHIWDLAMKQRWMYEPSLGASGLAAIGAAISAAVSENNRGDFDNSWLLPVWSEADGTTRRNFVNRLTPKAACRLAEFLWQRAKADQDGIAQMHTLDRSICRKLGASGAVHWRGTTVWSSLQKQWAATVTTAEENEKSLRWEEKKPEEAFDPQRWNGHPLNLLGWTLPSLLVSTPESQESASSIKNLLTRLEALVAQPTWNGNGRPSRDVGMQIALAEGCRDACYLGLTEGIQIPKAVTDVARRLLRVPRKERLSGLSWYARLVALQALFVAAAAAADSDHGPAEETEHPHKPTQRLLCTLRACQTPDEHPIVSRYASLLIRKLSAPHGKTSKCRIAEPHVTVGRLTWLDDNKAVSEAGGELDPEVVLVLAEAVCLLNFAGASELISYAGLSGTDKDSWPPERGRARTDGLKFTTALPMCFTRKRVAATAFKGCSGGCNIGVCGPGMYDAPVRRELSPTFIERCLELTRLVANVRRCLADARRDMRSAKGSGSSGSQRVWASVRNAALKFCQNRALRVHLQQISRPDPVTFKTAISAGMPENVQRSQWLLLRGRTNDAIQLRLYQTAASDDAYQHLKSELAKANLHASDTAAR